MQLKLRSCETARYYSPIAKNAIAIKIKMQNYSLFLKILEEFIKILMSAKIAKKIAFLRSRSLIFAIAIVMRSFDQMAIAISIAKKWSRSTIEWSPITHALIKANFAQNLLRQNEENGNRLFENYADMWLYCDLIIKSNLQTIIVHCGKNCQIFIYLEKGQFSGWNAVHKKMCMAFQKSPEFLSMGQHWLSLK